MSDEQQPVPQPPRARPMHRYVSQIQFANGQGGAMQTDASDIISATNKILGGLIDHPVPVPIVALIIQQQPESGIILPQGRAQTFPQG